MQKVLIIGLGGIGQRHTRNLRTLLGDSVEILAFRQRRLTHVVTPTLNAEHDRNVEDVYNIRSFDTLEAALAEHPNTAFIANPTRQHVPVAIQCARAGCDLFLEKPVSDSLDGTDELLQLVRDNQLIAMVGYQLRFHPCIQRLAAIVHSGALGNLLAVRSTLGEFLPNWHPYEDYRTMYAARADLGGGVVLTQIHELDFLYSIFGAPSRIYSVGGHWSDLDVDVEDTATSLLEVPWHGRTLPIQLHTDYLQSPPVRQTEVLGDRGRVLVDLPSLTVSLFKRNTPEPEIFRLDNFDRNTLFLDQTRHFLDCINTRSKPVVDLADGLASLRIALAIKQSIATHAPVDLVSR